MHKIGERKNCLCLLLVMWRLNQAYVRPLQTTGRWEFYSRLSVPLLMCSCFCAFHWIKFFILSLLTDTCQRFASSKYIFVISNVYKTIRNLTRWSLTQSSIEMHFDWIFSQYSCKQYRVLRLVTSYENISTISGCVIVYITHVYIRDINIYRTYMHFSPSISTPWMLRSNISSSLIIDKKIEHLEM